MRPGEQRATGGWRRGQALALVALAASLVMACTPFQPPRPPLSDPGLHPQPATGDWRVFGYDPARSGVNPSDTALTPTTIGKLTKLWQASLPAVAD
ncbi:MAG TPA: hypothetical protein VIC27_00860, partial [Ktedonobacterales bacterium]